MELRVEAASGYDIPNGCFVGVRVGDILKQEMRLKVHTKPSNNGKQREVRKMEVKKQARDYLGKHHIEERLSEAVKALLSAQPDNPTEFLCTHLRNTCPLKDMKPPAAPVAAKTTTPAAQLARQAPQAPVLPFDDYYRSKVSPAAPQPYWEGIYSKFPVSPGRSAAAAPSKAAISGAAAPQVYKDAGPGAIEKFTALRAGELRCDSESTEARGVFATNSEDMAVWINDGCHAQFLIQPQGSGPAAEAAAWARMENFEGILADAVKQDGYQYARVGACPTGQLLKLEGNLCGLGLPANASSDELHEVERVLTRVLLECSGELEGDYRPIPSSTSYVPMSGHEGTAGEQTDSKFKVRRNLQGLRHPAQASQEELAEVERIVAQALSEFSGEFSGEYLPLPGSTSCPLCPGGMSEEEVQALRAEGLLYNVKGPNGRGVFANLARDVAVWVNEGCHVQLLVQLQGSGPASETIALQRAERFEGILADAVKQDGYEYARAFLQADPAGRLLKLGGSLRGLCSPSTASVDELREAERVLASAVMECSGDLEGMYFPLPGSTSYFPMPGGMPEPEEADLRNRGLLFDTKGPSGCGIFINSARDLAVWVNEGCHIQILVKPRGGDPEQDAQRLKFVQDTLEAALRQSGYAFA